MINKCNNDIVNYYPKISILTPSYNQSDYIEQNILSVLNQHYPSFEHIIIDGGSTDNTLTILKTYPHLKWISEKDDGQADALNKGLSMAEGDIIGWINSDDYYEDNIFSEVATNFENKDVQWVIGNITCLYSGTKESIKIKSPNVTYENLIKNPDIVKQPATFFRKSALEIVGGWNHELYMIMDYDLWLRISRLSNPLMINKNWAYYRIHGDQKSSLKNIMLQIRELDCILKREGASLHLKIKTIKILYFIKGHVKQFLIRWGLLNKKYSQRPIRFR
ncbi:MAG: glycosyltransferase [Bacteroidales bacterium]|nr:glycosyltransferase [Bacteroidales bacterium]